jgi:hypothetical protein
LGLIDKRADKQPIFILGIFMQTDILNARETQHHGS